ncbi:hypothetical protein QUF80_00775 [Desulfococcaceae bacterium HSG8]|nr:hypothetical protein [Desulfococcaceae bacterium HSG8]
MERNPEEEIIILQSKVDTLNELLSVTEEVVSQRTGEASEEFSLSFRD